MNKKLVVVSICFVLFAVAVLYQQEDRKPKPIGNGADVSQRNNTEMVDRTMERPSAEETKGATTGSGKLPSVKKAVSQPVEDPRKPKELPRDAGVLSAHTNTKESSGRIEHTRATESTQNDTVAPPTEDPPMAPIKPRFALDRSGISQAVKSIVPDIKDCYQEWLKVNPGLGGVMKVKITIAVDPEDSTKGTVVEAKIVQSKVQNQFVEGCVVNALSELEFEPPTEGDFSFLMPFKFAAPDAGVFGDTGL